MTFKISVNSDDDICAYPTKTLSLLDKKTNDKYNVYFVSNEK